MVLIRKRKIYTTAIQFRGNNKRKVVNSRHFNLKVDPTHNVATGSGSPSRAIIDSSNGNDIVVESEDIISDPDIKDVRSRYEVKKTSCLKDWQEIRSTLYDTFISSEAPVSLKCQDCGDISLLYRCLDCMPYENVCQSCIQNRHPYPHLHIFEAFQGEAFVGAVIETPTWMLRFHDCDTTYLKEIIIVDDKGRQHTRQLQFCQCEAEAITLVRYRLWPSSTKFPKIAFHMELLKWLNGLLLECHVSVKGFCEALKARCSKHHRSYTNMQVKDIYKVLINETFPEFRHFIHSLEQLSNLTGCYKLDNGTECPACFSTVPKIYSFDADFQLVRKYSSGKQWEQPKHKDMFFLDQCSVDKFMEDYNADKKKPTVDCSEFQAGSTVRSKNKNKKLSETAVFGSTCRHEFPKYFFSLKHGERLGYSVYLLNKLLEEQANDTSPIYVMYDIACSLHSHIKKHAGESVLDKVKFSIPIFHSYGHKMDCQVLYGPRRTSGIGLTDGESLERLWSYLGRFSSITKEMTPENRIDLLTDALLHYGRKIRDKLGASLTGKLKKASMLENSSRNSLQELLDPLTGISHDDVTKWIDEEKNNLASSASDKNVPLTSQEQYCLKLDSLHKMGDTTHSIEEDAKYKKVTATVKKMETKLKIKWKKSDDAFKSNLSTAKDKIRMSILIKLQRNIAERHFLLDLIKKYARGQAIAIRLCRQLKKIVAKIKQLIKEYNEVGAPGISRNLPLFLSFDDVKSHDSVIWEELDMQGSSDIPPTVKRQAIHLKSMIDRAIEEQGLVKQEMASVIEWYKSQHFLIKGAIENSVSKGSRSCLIREGLFVETKLGEIVKSFSSVHNEKVDVPSTFFDIVGLANQINFVEQDIVSDFEVSNKVELDDEDLHDLEFDDDLPLDDELDLIEDELSLESGEDGDLSSDDENDD